MSSHQVTVSPKDGADGKPDFNNQERPNLTFGIEFEFALATLPPRYEDPDPKDRRQVRDLSHPPFKVDRSEAPSKCLYRTEVQTPLLAAELQIIQDHVATRLEERGLKSVDESISPPPLMYQFANMEVVSPAFFSSPKALNEVNLVCETLPRKYRLATNTSCSVHVHVGNGDRGFTLEHLQNMMALFWVFEGQLDSIHPYHRVKGTKTYSGALRFDTVLAYNLRGNKNAARDGISRIFATQNINDIIRLFDVSHVSQSRVRKSRYNIGNLEEYEPARFNAYLVQRTKKTTEFRHHEATFDVEAVNQWVRMCVHLVEFAEEIKRDKLGAWLEQHANTEYSVIQILEATKQPLAAFYYERKLAAKAALGLDTLEPES